MFSRLSSYEQLLFVNFNNCFRAFVLACVLQLKENKYFWIYWNKICQSDSDPCISWLSFPKNDLPGILYARSLAFQAVTGISLWWTITGIAFVCTLYAAWAEWKLLWTNSLQLSIMIADPITILFQGSNVTWGFSKSWEIAEQNGRIVLTDLSLDPKTRHSVWALSIGSGLYTTYIYGVNQAQIQRAYSLPSLRKAQIAVWMNLKAFVLVKRNDCTIACLYRWLLLVFGF